jgi:hypothetical protein
MPVLLLIPSEYLELNAGIGVYPDVEDFAVAGKPGISPTAVVAYADGRNAVDEAKGNALGHTTSRNSGPG